LKPSESWLIKKKKELRKEVKHVAKKREAISRLLKDRHDNHKLEKKKTIQDQYKNHVD
jgi:hypothetical protein